MQLDVSKIKKLRERIGLSQAQAAKQASFPSGHYWSDIEAGRRCNPTLNTLNKVADALGVTAKDLLK